jgi:hypothetical protein
LHSTRHWSLVVEDKIVAGFLNRPESHRDSSTPDVATMPDEPSRSQTGKNSRIRNNPSIHEFHTRRENPFELLMLLHML